MRRKSAVINIYNNYHLYIAKQYRFIKILITQRLNSINLNTIIHDKNHELNTDNPIYAYIVGLFEGDG